MKKVKFPALLFVLLTGYCLAREHSDNMVMTAVGTGDQNIFVMKKVKHGDLNLTPEQEKQFRLIELDFEKQKLPWSQKLEARQLDFQSEMLMDKPNKQTLYAIVDETSKYKAELLKKDIEMKFKLRDLLTDEQKVIWDKSEGVVIPDFSSSIHIMEHDSPVWISKDKDMDITVRHDTVSKPDIKIEHK